MSEPKHAETRPDAGPANPAVAAGYLSKSTVVSLCRGVIEGRLHPHEIPTPLHDLWRDGFIEGAIKARMALQREIKRLEHDVNHWYVAANYSPAEIAEMRRKASYLQANINWETGVIA